MKKYALVTGGSRGIGAAIASQLAADGYHVIINYRSNAEAAKETLRAIEDAGGEGELLPFDVTEEHTVDEALEQWEERHPDAYISVLVNNAGVRSDNLMVFMETEQWNRVMGASLNGFFFVTRRLLKNMMTHRNGRIVNIDSLDFVDIVVIVEKNFGFKIKPEEMANVKTLDDFYKYIATKVG